MERRAAARKPEASPAQAYLLRRLEGSGSDDWELGDRFRWLQSSVQSVKTNPRGGGPWECKVEGCRGHQALGHGPSMISDYLQ